MAEKPTVTVAMAVYKPNIDWFIKQLQSINNQDYRPLDLLIWNDSPIDFDGQELVAKYARDIPHQILNNEKNNGVTKAFEKLTENTHGKYIAYSDQDDIWMPRKISIMVDFMEKHPSCVCCHSDVELIDGGDRIVQKSIYPRTLKEINDVRYQKRTFLVKSWNVGCAMMMTTQAARAAIPFPTMVYHDQWLEMYALSVGEFCYIPDRLIKHRVHDANNSQTLHGINTKEDYYNVKLAREVHFFSFLVKRLPYKDIYQNEAEWIEARKEYRYTHNISTFITLLKCLKNRPTITLFELMLPFIPNRVFSSIVKIIRKEVKAMGYR